MSKKPQKKHKNGDWVYDVELDLAAKIRGYQSWIDGTWYYCHNKLGPGSPNLAAEWRLVPIESEDDKPAVRRYTKTQLMRMYAHKEDELSRVIRHFSNIQHEATMTRGDCEQLRTKLYRTECELQDAKRLLADLVVLGKPSFSLDNQNMSDQHNQQAMMNFQQMVGTDKDQIRLKTLEEIDAEIDAAQQRNRR